MRAFAVPCRRFATLANALAMPSSPRKAVALNRYALARLRFASPLHTNAPPSPRGQRHAHAGRCGAPLRSRVSVLRRRPAVRSMLCRRQPAPCFATPQLCDAILSPCYANLRPRLADHALPSRCCPKPCRRDALLRSASAALARAFPCPSWAVHCPCLPVHCFAFARRSGAAQCRRRASHCPAFAMLCPAVPPLIGAPTCLASASPCSALALLCHPAASPSLAIALLRRATP